MRYLAKGQISVPYTPEHLRHLTLEPLLRSAQIKNAN